MIGITRRIQKIDCLLIYLGQGVVELVKHAVELYSEQSIGNQVKGMYPNISIITTEWSDSPAIRNAIGKVAHKKHGIKILREARWLVILFLDT